DGVGAPSAATSFPSRKSRSRSTKERRVGLPADPAHFGSRRERTYGLARWRCGEETQRTVVVLHVGSERRKIGAIRGEAKVTAELGAMGKLADFDEYVSINAQSPLFIAFDRWVADGMDAAPEASADWGACYHAGAVQAFVYAPLPARPFLAGALAPSADRAG